MKKLTYLFLALLIFACSSDDSATDEFNEANGNVQVKLIESISIVSAQDSQDNKMLMEKGYFVLIYFGWILKYYIRWNRYQHICL